MVNIVIPEVIVIIVAAVWIVGKIINICNNLNKLRGKENDEETEA